MIKMHWQTVMNHKTRPFKQCCEAIVYNWFREWRPSMVKMHWQIITNHKTHPSCIVWTYSLNWHGTSAGIQMPIRLTFFGICPLSLGYETMWDEHHSRLYPIMVAMFILTTSTTISNYKLHFGDSTWRRLHSLIPMHKHTHHPCTHTHNRWEGEGMKLTSNANTNSCLHFLLCT